VPRILALDVDDERIPAMVGNLRAARLTGPAYERSLVIAGQDVRLLTPEYVHRMLPAAHDMKPGVFCFNPPYGVRMAAGDEKKLLQLYSDMGRVLSRFSGWRAACFVANPRFEEMFGHAPVMTKPASNAELRGNFLVYEFR
jgi:putative N6-adenine-specific DNA methylase